MDWKAWLVGLGAVATSLTVMAAPNQPDLGAEAAAMRPWLVEQRRWFHAHPELSNREVDTGKAVARRLAEMGLTVQTGVAGNGVVGVLTGGKPGPTVVHRADMDALPITETRDVPYKSQNPGVMHACGHDIHTAVGLGVAKLLSQRRASLRGTVKFLFQPAEEGPPAGEEGGARLVVREGVLTPAPAAVFGLHVAPQLPVGTMGWRAGPMMAAADRFVLTVHGKSAHGAQPQHGVDAVYVGAQVVTGLQAVVSRQQDARAPLVLTIGSFHAGNRFNIIAADAVMEGTVRTLDPDTHARSQAAIGKVVGGITTAYGARYALDYQELAPVVVNEVALTRRSVPVLEQALGAGRAVEVEPVMIAEDFGFYAQQAPSLFLFLGVGNAAAGITGNIHTPDFQADEDALVVGVKAMAAVVIARGNAQ